MQPDNPSRTWWARLRGWYGRAFGRARPTLPAPYPDYVACPHCGEPEVEVWCNEPQARCHNCGRTFAHAIPPGCVSGSEDGPQPAP